MSIYATPSDLHFNMPEPNSFSANPSAIAEKFESFYQKIGWWKGPHATLAAHQAIREFWTHSGRRGAEWLTNRVAKESHIDILDGVAGLLAQIGRDSIDPIVKSLASEPKPPRDQAEVLLKALGWIEVGPHAASNSPGILEEVLQFYLGHSDPDLREAACGAIHILPDERAASVLRSCRPEERDPSVIVAMDEAAQRYN